MNPGEILYFAPFRIEVGKRQLWRGEEKVELRPMSVLVLAYLVSRAGEVVQTEEILQAVWARTRVLRGAIRVCIREIRQALGDEASAPHYIETIGREGLIQYRATGAQLTLPYYLSLLAEAYRQMEKPAEGLQVVAEALQIGEVSLDVFWEAELYRLKGELTLQQSSIQRLASSAPKNTKSKIKSGGSKTPSARSLAPSTHPEAEVYFLQAIEIARRQNAKLLELRAVTSLARLWQHQGKNAEAQSMLAETYGWFTEGFNTPDLRAAQTLLEGLTENGRSVFSPQLSAIKDRSTEGKL